MGKIKSWVKYCWGGVWEWDCRELGQFLKITLMSDELTELIPWSQGGFMEKRV